MDEELVERLKVVSDIIWLMRMLADDRNTDIQLYSLSSVLTYVNIALMDCVNSLDGEAAEND